MSDQTVHNWLREAGVFPRNSATYCLDLTSLSVASAVVPVEGEMDTCQVEDYSCHMLRDTHVSIDVERNVFSKLLTTSHGGRMAPI